MIDNKTPRMRKENLDIKYKPSIHRVDIPQMVSVRKYEVDTDALCESLRHHKAQLGLNNNEISSKLNVPVTTVEHWFRKDACFSIPEPNTWLELKELLHIKTSEFDEGVMTFEEKEGVFEKSERHYMSDGVAPTLTRTTVEKIIDPSLRIRRLLAKEYWRLMDFSDEDFEKAAKVNTDTQLYNQAGNAIVKNILVAVLGQMLPGKEDSYKKLSG